MTGINNSNQMMMTTNNRTLFIMSNEAMTDGRLVTEEAPLGIYR